MSSYILIRSVIAISLDAPARSPVGGSRILHAIVRYITNIVVSAVFFLFFFPHSLNNLKSPPYILSSISKLSEKIDST